MGETIVSQTKILKILIVISKIIITFVKQIVSVMGKNFPKSFPFVSQTYIL